MIRFFTLRNKKVLLKDLWQARRCCWEVHEIALLIVIWITGKQASWLAWVNISLRPPYPPFFLFFSVDFCYYWLSW